MISTPRIALIHATPVAMEPIQATFGRAWPEAQTINILEDSLSPDRARSPVLSPELYERIRLLADYAWKSRADAVLFTCSAFGQAIDRAAATLPIPVLKPNQAMFEAAIAQGGNVAMVYTFAPAREGMEEEFREAAKHLNRSAAVTSLFVEGAIEAVRAGDADTHNRLVAAAVAGLQGFDAIMLAHFSTARALQDVRAVTSIPVFSSPDAAVEKLRGLMI